MESYLAGVIVGLMFAVLFFWIIKRKCHKGIYDERQEIIRGKGYTLGFFVMLYGECIIVFLNNLDFEIPVTEGVLNFLILLLGVMTYAVYCIFNNAYIALNQKASTAITFLLPVGILNFLLGVDYIRTGEAFTSGRLNERIFSLLTGIVLFIVVLAMLIKRISDKRKSMEE